MKNIHPARRRRRLRKRSRDAATSQSLNNSEKTRLKPNPIPAFNNRFAAALVRFGAAFLETSGIKHSGIKGAHRENTFQSFLAARLPSRYDVTRGEVVDQFNVVSPQLDVLVFDKTRDFSFADGENSILPAEALFASIEVKSTLNSGEVQKSCDAARKLRALKPFKVALGGRNIGADAKQPNNRARYLHCVFAYGTDLSETKWLTSEAQRFQQHGSSGEHLIDAVYVLRRGLLNLNSGRGRLEDPNGSAITSFYFSILNFLQRESRRRGDTPYQEYASLLSGKWINLS